MAALNELQPTELIGFSSMLLRLAREAQAGRLHIRPRRVAAIAEPLLPEARTAIQQAWEAPVGNRYALSEGIFAGFCGHATHLPDDLCIFEPVDADGRPVAPGVRSAKVYVTNLYNLVQPLVRYEVTDEVTLFGGRCICGSVFQRIADPQGRLDDIFVYPGGVTVHPHVFRSVLGQQSAIIEYQVHQTEQGATIQVVADIPLDTGPAAVRLEQALTAVGLAHPRVTLREVTALERPGAGKLKRFIPLARP